MTGMHKDLAAIHLNQLLLVEALQADSNLSDAAERIGMSQSAASHALARLRKELGDPIFIRTAEGMQPTPFGARLAARVSESL
jgi:DNA-binding transcriptional LysR family regulator